MKIVIDIDNESYEHIKAFKNEDVLPIGWYAIIHGTPLTSDGTDINVGSKNCILDKIRAEIEAKCCITVGRENDGAITLHDVFEIIDKYKAEQEPILDKIRAEIESCRVDAEPHLCDYRYYRNEGLDMALDIIDKYRTESEDKE